MAGGGGVKRKKAHAPVGALGPGEGGGLGAPGGAAARGTGERVAEAPPVVARMRAVPHQERGGGGRSTEGSREAVQGGPRVVRRQRASSRQQAWRGGYYRTLLIIFSNVLLQCWPFSFALGTLSDPTPHTRPPTWIVVSTKTPNGTTTANTWHLRCAVSKHQALRACLVNERTDCGLQDCERVQKSAQ